MMESAITPEYLEMLAGLGVSEDKLYELRRQMEDAQMRRDATGPQGATAGGIYVAANPLEHLASGIGQVRGHRDMQKAQTGIEANLQSQQDAINKAMALRAAGGMGGMGGATVPGSPGSMQQLRREQQWQMGQRSA